MIKVNLKSNKINEIKEKELIDIQDIISGNQFEELFSGKQRIILPVEEKFVDHKQVLYSYEDDEKLAANEYMKVFENLLKESKTDKSEYKINYSEAVFVKKYKHIIPKTGQEIIKEKKISLSKLAPVLLAGFDNDQTEFSQLRIWMDDVPPSVIPILSEANNFSLYFKAFADEEIKQKLKVDKRKYAVDLFPWLLGKNAKPHKFFIDVFKKLIEYSGDQLVVISRAPVDLLRMSDFPSIDKSGKLDYEKGIVSCHSPIRLVKIIDPDTGDEEYEKTGGTYYDCAVQESRNNGAVAYLISKKSLDGYEDKIDSRDFFKDVERNIKGPYPIQRLRMRRYYNIKFKKELLVPELSTYPQGGSLLFKNVVDNWCKEKQSSLIAELKSDKQADLSDYVLIGGFYSDSTTTELIQSFLGIQIREPGDRLSSKDKKLSEKIYSTHGNESFANMLELGGVQPPYEVMTLPGHSYKIEQTGNNFVITYQNIDLFVDFAGIDKIATEEEYKQIVKDLFEEYADKHVEVEAKTKIEDNFTLKINLKLKINLNKSEEDTKKILGFSNILNKIFMSPENELSIEKTAALATFRMHMFHKIMKKAKEKYAGKPPGIKFKKSTDEGKRIHIRLRG